MDPQTRLELIETGNELLVSVNNQGPAIPMDELERVFDKFHPVRQQDHKGATGLGLSICKGMVEAHQGRIWAENRSESRVWFTFALPLTPANKPDHPAPLIERRDYPTEEKRMTTKGALILIVDDERAIRRFLKAGLSSHGVKVTEAGVGCRLLDSG